MNIYAEFYPLVVEMLDEFGAKAVLKASPAGQGNRLHGGGVVKFDLSQLIASLAAVEHQIDNTVLAVSQKITLDVHANVVRGSPVDTGAFRGAWSVDVPKKPYADGKVENNTVYGPRLVHGWSDQAPSGWVQNAVTAATKLGGQ